MIKLSFEIYLLKNNVFFIEAACVLKVLHINRKDARLS